MWKIHETSINKTQQWVVYPDAFDIMFYTVTESQYLDELQSEWRLERDKVHNGSREKSKSSIMMMTTTMIKSLGILLFFFS